MMIGSIEFTNIALMLTQQTIMDIVLNFLALVILSEIDDILFESVKNTPVGKLMTEGEYDFGTGEPRKLEDMLRITKTTSKFAQPKPEDSSAFLTSNVNTTADSFVRNSVNRNESLDEPQQELWS